MPDSARLRLVAAGVVLVAAGCAVTAPTAVPSLQGSPAPSGPPATGPASGGVQPGALLSGTVTLREGPVVAGPDGCRGTGAHADVRTGGTIVVRDAETSIELASGVLQDAGRTGDPGVASRFLECRYTFRITGVRDASAYEIEVPGVGSVVYPAAELETLRTQLRFTTGGPAPDAAPIPGTSVGTVERKLDVRCDQPPVEYGEVITHTCEGVRAGIPVAATIDVLRDGAVLRVQAVAAQGGVLPARSVTEVFLEDAARLPWLTGGTANAASDFVRASLETGGETTIEGVDLQVVVADPAAPVVLVLRGAGDPLSAPSPVPTATSPVDGVGPVVDVSALIDLQGAEPQDPARDPLAVYRDAALTFDATWVGGGEADCPTAPEPAWLACSAFSLQAPGDSRKVGAPQLFVAIHPSVTLPSLAPAYAQVRVTGHFDDPAAQRCHDTQSGDAQELAPAAEVVERCRRVFVVTTVAAR